ncbi:MAG: hypothetical protein E7353_05785 [Clostridiales bacterium]|nr:hypothetical protein [Clostridiales bacterium]
MGFEDKRKTLDALRVDNRNLTAGICSKIEKIDIKTKNRSIIDELKENFQSYEKLAFIFIPESGEKYYDALIAHEKKVNVFLGETFNIITHAEKMSDKEKIEKYLIINENLQELQRGGTLMQDSILKQELIKVLEKTVKDVQYYNEALNNLETNDEYTDEKKAESLQMITLVADGLQKTIDSIGKAVIEDTAEFKKAVDGIVKNMLELRSALPVEGNSFTLQDKIALLLDSIDGLKKVKVNGKKIKEKDCVLPDTVLLTKDNVDSEFKNADELSSAIFILKFVASNTSFLSSQEKHAVAEIRKIAQKYDLSKDRVYQEMLRLANELKEKVKGMNPKDPRYVQLARLAIAKQKECVEYEQRVNAKSGKVLKVLEKMEKELHSTCLDIKDICEMYGFDSRMTYKARLNVMAETKVYDFRELFNKYVEALYNSDTETIDKVKVKLEVIKEKYIEELGPEIEFEYDDAENIAIEQPAELTAEEIEMMKIFGITADEEKPAEEEKATEEVEIENDDVLIAEIMEELK